MIEAGTGEGKLWCRHSDPKRSKCSGTSCHHHWSGCHKLELLLPEPLAGWEEMELPRVWKGISLLVTGNLKIPQTWYRTL